MKKVLKTPPNLPLGASREMLSNDEDVLEDEELELDDARERLAAGLFRL